MQRKLHRLLSGWSRVRVPPSGAPGVAQRPEHLVVSVPLAVITIVEPRPDAGRGYIATVRGAGTAARARYAAYPGHAHRYQPRAHGVDRRRMPRELHGQGVPQTPRVQILQPARASGPVRPLGAANVSALLPPPLPRPHSSRRQAVEVGRAADAAGTRWTRNAVRRPVLRRRRGGMSAGHRLRPTCCRPSADAVEAGCAREYIGPPCTVSRATLAGLVACPHGH